jgi:hypothetical protein
MFVCFFLRSFVCSFTRFECQKEERRKIGEICQAGSRWVRRTNDSCIIFPFLEPTFCLLFFYRVTKGVIVGEDNTTGNDFWDDLMSNPLPPLGSSEDLEAVKKKPLGRARVALEMALELFGENDSDVDDLPLQSARLSLAYVCLERKEFKEALNYAELVLQGRDSDAGMDSARRTMFKRQQATAKLYASEANAMLGDSMESMKHLVGDGQNDVIDRLASDLGGVTLEMASGNPKAKARLARAQTMVRCSASAASACLGNLTACKQLALGAQAMENSYSASREGSAARKALLYCMLREGNHSAALSLLRSAR